MKLSKPEFVVSTAGENELISHKFHPIYFSPGFASSINLQFSVEQSHDALQITVSFCAPTASIIQRVRVLFKFHYDIFKLNKFKL